MAIDDANARRKASQLFSIHQQQRVSEQRSPIPTGNHSADVGRFEVGYQGGGKAFSGVNQVGSQPGSGSAAVPVGDHILLYQDQPTEKLGVNADLEFFGAAVDRQGAILFLSQQFTTVESGRQVRSSVKLWNKLSGGEFVLFDTLDESRLQGLPNDYTGEVFPDPPAFVVGDRRGRVVFVRQLSPVNASCSVLDANTVFWQLEIGVYLRNPDPDTLEGFLVDFSYQAIGDPNTGVVTQARLLEKTGRDTDLVPYDGVWAEYQPWGIKDRGGLPSDVLLNNRGFGTGNFDRAGRVYGTTPNFETIFRTTETAVTEYAGCEYNTETGDWDNCMLTDKLPIDHRVQLNQWASLGYGVNYPVFGIRSDPFDDVSLPLSEIYTGTDSLNVASIFPCQDGSPNALNLANPFEEIVIHGIKVFTL